MKVKNGVVLLFLVLISLSLFACGNVTVKDDLKNYIDEWHSKMGDRVDTNRAEFNSAINENFIDYDTLYSDINDDIMPDLKDAIGIAEKIEPKTDEVKAVHEKYLNALNMQLEAYELILTAIESQDSEDSSKAGDKLAEAGDEAQDFATALSEMAEKYGIELGDKDLNTSTEADDGAVSFVPVNGEFQMNVDQFVSIMDLELSNNGYKKMSEWDRIEDQNINGGIYVTYALNESFIICLSTVDDGNIKGFSYFMKLAGMDPETSKTMGYLLVRTVGIVDLEQSDGIINSLGKFPSVNGTMANASGTNADYSYFVEDGGAATFSVDAKQ